MTTGTGPRRFSDLEIINQALVGMGDDRLTDLQSSLSARATVMVEKYDQTVEACMVLPPWRFATTKATLAKLSAAPTNRWQAAYQLPADHLRTLFVYPNAYYEIQGQRLLSNETNGIDIDYVRYVESEYWPAWFRQYVIMKLIVVTREGVTGDEPSATDYRNLSSARADANFADASQQPNFVDLPNPFIDARY
jgi:hypothetical protein